MLSLTWSNKSFKLKPKLKKRNSKQNGQAWRHGGTNQIYDVSLYHDDFCKTFEVDWKCHDCCMEFCICCLRLPLLLLQIVILFGDLFITRLNFAFLRSWSCRNCKLTHLIAQVWNDCLVVFFCCFVFSESPVISLFSLTFFS